MEQDEKTFISLEVPLQVAIDTRVEASKQNISRSELLRQAIECFRLFDGSLPRAQEAAAALNFMRERYGENWQEELVK